MIAMILRDISPDDTRTYLIIATGNIENTLQFHPQAPRPGNLPPWAPVEWRSEGTWAADPFEVRVEGIGAYIILPVPAGNVTFHSLNPDGSEQTLLDVDDLENYCGLQLSENNQTLWYKVVITP
jgi:hypothetical protein